MFNQRGNNMDGRGRGRGRGGAKQQIRRPQNNKNQTGDAPQPKFKHKQWTRPGLNKPEPVAEAGGSMSNAQRAKRFGGDDKSALLQQVNISYIFHSKRLAKLVDS